MKKKLLFVLMLFVTLTGFSIKEVEAPGNPNVAEKIFSSESGLPRITNVAPDLGKVKGFEGQIITFYIEYTANPGATYKIYKINGSTDEVIGGSDVSKTEGKAVCEIRNAKITDSGDYKIVVSNSVGSVEQMFKVTITPVP